MKIIVGSQNKVKIEAALSAFQTLWPDQEWQAEGVSVASGVSDQPMSDEESICGARNRATRAMQASSADYAVGLEGGLHKIGNDYFDTGWIVVVDANGREGIGSTIRLITPPVAVEMIQQGMELGSVNDALFGKVNSKQDEGHFGLMTNNAIPRSQGYKDGVIAALSRFLHPKLFEA